MWALKISLKIIFSIFYFASIFCCFKSERSKKHFFRLKMLSRGNFSLFRRRQRKRRASLAKDYIFEGSKNHFMRKTWSEDLKMYLCMIKMEALCEHCGYKRLGIIFKLCDATRNVNGWWFYKSFEKTGKIFFWVLVWRWNWGIFEGFKSFNFFLVNFYGRHTILYNLNYT